MVSERKGEYGRELPLVQRMLNLLFMGFRNAMRNTRAIIQESWNPWTYSRNGHGTAGITLYDWRSLKVETFLSDFAIIRLRERTKECSKRTRRKESEKENERKNKPKEVSTSKTPMND